jgi:hypothetical protein
MHRHIRHGGLLALLATGCVVGGGERTVHYEGLAGLRVELGNGDVHVVGDGSQGDRTEVQLDLGGVGRRAARGEEWIDDDGWLNIDARGVLGGGDIEATVPAGLAVEVWVERGDATVEQPVRADVSGCVAAGALHVEVPQGGYRLSLDGGAGAVFAEGVWHDAGADRSLDLCVGAGELSVEGATTPR